MSAPSAVVVIRIPADLKDEKPDDYDKVSLPVRVLKRLFRVSSRLIKGPLLALWKRCFGPQHKQ